MDSKMMAIIETVRKTNPEVERLYHVHQDLNRQVDVLNERPHLTTGEEAELTRLKKEKLHIRDLLESHIHQRKSA